MSDEITVRIECLDCDGSGIEHTMHYPYRVGSVCWCCEGKGYRDVKYTPFIERKKRDDVDTVYHWEGNILMREIKLDTEAGISYEQFLNGQMPPVGKMRLL